MTFLVILNEVKDLQQYNFHVILNEVKDLKQYNSMSS